MGMAVGGRRSGHSIGRPPGAPAARGRLVAPDGSPAPPKHRVGVGFLEGRELLQGPIQLQSGIRSLRNRPIAYRNPAFE